ncbi:hypothetical protein ACGC1H_001854 [Rhizoctonia solani]
MSNLTPYNQHEYRPLQLAPPLVPNQLIQPLVQQPSSGAQQQLQVIQPTQPSSQPSEYGQNASAHFPGIAYPPPPPSPFDWIVSTVTSLLHSQHATVLAKLNEASEQQLDLATKVQTLQQNTNALQQTVNTILEDIQQVSDKVAKLGTDMSSRDATLAERLNTLDDAIDAWPIDVRLATGAAPVGELQTPPGSEADTRAQPPVIQDQSAVQPVVQDTPEQDQQLQSLDSLVQNTGSVNGHGSIQPELDDNSPPALRISPGLSSIQQDTIAPAALTQSIANSLKTPSRGKNAGTAQTAPLTTRRSNRQSKKRERNDGTVEMPTSKKRAKTVPKREARVSGKTPRKSILSQFNWNSVPIQDEEFEQLIYCDKYVSSKYDQNDYSRSIPDVTRHTIGDALTSYPRTPFSKLTALGCVLHANLRISTALYSAVHTTRMLNVGPTAPFKIMQRICSLLTQSLAASLTRLTRPE